MNTLLTTVSYNGLGLPLFDEHGFHGDCFFSQMGLWSLCIAIATVALIIGLSYCIDRRYKWFEELVNKYLTHAFVAVWLFGFMVYDIGMYTGEPWSLLGNVPMAIIHAFEIFVLESDVCAIHEPFHNNVWFMFGFSLVHFLAALISLVFVLRHFGYSVIAAFKRWFLLSSKDTTYVFWGMNDATYYLAKDINQRYAENGNKNYRIVVVRTNNDINTSVVKNGMERLFNFLSLKKNELDRFKEIDCISMSTYSNLATIETKTNEETSSIDILRKKLRLKSLCRIIAGKTKKNIHLFFLSDEEDTNIQAVANIRFDKEIQDFAKRGKVKMYCHARYNSIHRVIEDELTCMNIEVQVVDSSHISVELMKQKEDLQPVSYVDIQPDATVSSQFNSLIVGFGEVGIDTLRFLYEFGSFVKKGSTNAHVIPSDFNCHVFDKDIKKLAGSFMVNAPSIQQSKNFFSPSSPIVFYPIDCNDSEFYKILFSQIIKLNYIVLATGDDDLNISLAVRILRLAIRKRNDNLNHFRIMVRVQHDESGHIQNIADYYNRLWAAEKEDNGEKKEWHQKQVESKARIDSPITLFGSFESVYTYKNIIDDFLKEKAKTFKKKYDLSIVKLKQQSGLKTDPVEEWEDEQNKAMQLVGEFEGYSPTLGGVMRLRRVQSQNIANCLHEITKIRLAKRALGDEKYNLIFRNGLTRKDGELKYIWTNRSNEPIDEIQRVLDVLAQTEHLRWNASHEILGYTGNEDENFKDEARLIHGCLREWEGLTDEKKSYDYNIVDVSLGIIDVNNNNI